jgi:antitoxin MazE
VLNALRYDGVAGAAACIDNDNTCGRSVYRCGSAENEGVMKVVVKKWGNSASVRIPASVMAAAALSLDQAVDVREEAGRIVIEPIREAAFELDDLVAGITEENRHDPVETGAPSGREFW